MAYELPEFPSFDDMPRGSEVNKRGPNAALRTVLRNRFENLDGSFTPQMRGARNAALAGLAGYGDYYTREDDPSTRLDESLDIERKKNRRGERQNDAINQTADAFNARGMLYSSLAKQNIASAVKRLDEQARGIVMQYAADIDRKQAEKFEAGTRLLEQVGSLWGEDAQYVIENPTPAPVMPETLWTGKNPPNMETLRARHPGVNLKKEKMPDGTWKVTT